MIYQQHFVPQKQEQHDHQLICLHHGAVDAVHGSSFPIYIDVFQVRNQIVQKWIVQRNSPILFWRFRGVIGSGSLSTWAYYQIYQKIWVVVHALERLQSQGDDKTGQFLASIMRFQFINSGTYFT
jgi:hypothetical protein